MHKSSETAFASTATRGSKAGSVRARASREMPNQRFQVELPSSSSSSFLMRALMHMRGSLSFQALLELLSLSLSCCFFNAPRVCVDFASPQLWKLSDNGRTSKGAHRVSNIFNPLTWSFLKAQSQDCGLSFSELQTPAASVKFAYLFGTSAIDPV